MKMKDRIIQAFDIINNSDIGEDDNKFITDLLNDFWKIVKDSDESDLF